MSKWVQLIAIHIIAFCGRCETTTNSPSTHPTPSPILNQQTYTLLNDPKNLPFWICIIVIIFLGCIFGIIWICLCIRCRTQGIQQKYVAAKKRELEEISKTRRLEKIKSISETTKSRHTASSQTKLKSPSSFTGTEAINSIHSPSTAPSIHSIVNNITHPSSPYNVIQLQSVKTPSKQTRNIDDIANSSKRVGMNESESSESEENLGTKIELKIVKPSNHTSLQSVTPRTIHKHKRHKSNKSKSKKHKKKKHHHHRSKTVPSNRGDRMDGEYVTSQQYMTSPNIASDVESVDVDDIIIDTENNQRRVTRDDMHLKYMNINSTKKRKKDLDKDKKRKRDKKDKKDKKRDKKKKKHKQNRTMNDDIHNRIFPRNHINNKKNGRHSITSGYSKDGDKSTHWYSDGDDDIYLVNEMEKEFAKNKDEVMINIQNKLQIEQQFSMNLQNNLNEEKLITEDIVNSMEHDIGSPISPISPQSTNINTINTMDKVSSNATSNGDNTGNQIYAQYCGLE